MFCKGKRVLHKQMKPLLLWFSLPVIWVLGLDPRSCHPGRRPVAARMGDVCLAHLVSHLPDVPVVLLVWILQKIRVLESLGKNQQVGPRPSGSSQTDVSGAVRTTGLLGGEEEPGTRSLSWAWPPGTKTFYFNAFTVKPE